MKIGCGRIITVQEVAFAIPVVEPCISETVYGVRGLIWTIQEFEDVVAQTIVGALMDVRSPMFGSVMTEGRQFFRCPIPTFFDISSILDVQSNDPAKVAHTRSCDKWISFSE